MATAKKERADLLLVQRGFFSTRERAKAAILEGAVLFNNKVITKVGTLVDKESAIEVKKPPKYVSRGGLKLEKALQSFSVNVAEKVAIDVGASTGGFTDCLLKFGAGRVIAVDVGYGQFAWGLRNDSRVHLIERTNVRYLESRDIPEKADIAVVDVSFISVLKIIDNLLLLLKQEADLIILIKPQFEAGPSSVGKKGVIRDPKVHKDVLLSQIEKFRLKDLVPCALTYSPLKGPKGNIEFLLLLTKGKTVMDGVTPKLIDAVVTEAHLTLRRNRIEIDQD